MKEYRFHKYAEIFPSMGQEELEELARDISADLQQTDNTAIIEGQPIVELIQQSVEGHGRVEQRSIEKAVKLTKEEADALFSFPKQVISLLLKRRALRQLAYNYKRDAP